jgi:O-antigen/teichoic acid export membrane protein
MQAGSLIARGMVVQVLGRVCGIALSFASLIVTVSYLGASRYGVLVTVVAFVGLFESLTDLGVATVIIRRVTAGQGRLERLVGVNLGLSVLFAVPLALVTVISGSLIYWGRPDVQLGIAMVSVGLVFTALYSCFSPIYEVAVRFGAFTAADLIARAVGLVLILLVVEQDAGLEAVLAVQVLPPFVNLVVLVAASKGRGRFRPVFDRHETLDLLREGLPLAGIILIAVAYFRADSVLLSLLSSNVQVGAYGVAYRVAGNVAMVATLYRSTTLSTLTRGFATGPEAFSRIAARSLEVMLLFAAPVLVFGILLAPSFVAFIDPELVPVAVLPMALLFAATAALCVNSILSGVLVAAHEQRLLLRLSCVALALNVVMNVALIPRWGAAGAGVALIASEAFSVLAAITIVRRAMSLELPRWFLTRLLAAMALTLLVWWPIRSLPLLVVLPLIGLAYAIALIVVRLVRVSELRMVMGAMLPGGTASDRGASTTTSV